MKVNGWMNLLHFFHFQELKFKFLYFEDEFVSALYIYEKITIYPFLNLLIIGGHVIRHMCHILSNVTQHIQS